MINRRPILTSATALVAVVATSISLGACSSSSSDSNGGSGSANGGVVQIVASTNVWGDVAKTIGGDRVTVTSFINDPSQDPHSYEANTRNQLAIKQAGLVIENGGGYDDFMQTLLNAVGGKKNVVNAVKVSGKGGADLNEHVWYDFPTVSSMAKTIAAELKKLDPAHANTFDTNLAAFDKQIDGLKAQADAIKGKHQGEPVAITEPVPGYLLEACGLVDKTPEAFSEAIEEGNDVSVAVLNQTLKLFSDHQVKVLVYNEQTTGPITERVLGAAKSAGVPDVPVTETLPEGTTYVTWMHAQIQALSTALGGS